MILFGSAVIETIYLPFVCVSHFTESRSNPDEWRLRQHLFEHEYKTEDLTTTPVATVQQTMNVSVSIYIIKLIALVKTNSFLFSDKPSCCSLIDSLRVVHTAYQKTWSLSWART